MGLHQQGKSAKSGPIMGRPLHRPSLDKEHLPHLLSAVSVRVSLPPVRNHLSILEILPREVKLPQWLVQGNLEGKTMKSSYSQENNTPWDG